MTTRDDLLRAWMTSHTLLRGNAAVVCAYLISQYDEEKGYAAPSIERIERALDLSTSGVCEATKKVRDSGLWSVERGRGGPARARLDAGPRSSRYYPTGLEEIAKSLPW